MSETRFSRNLLRALDRFRRISPLSLPRQVARAARLHLPVRRAAPAAPPPARAERLVVSLSTIPARAGLIGPALRSLLDQDEPANRVVLALPFRSLRDGTPYPEPETLGLPAGIDVLRCADDGPATKFLPALRAEPDALLVVADDDVVYPRSFLRELLSAHRRRPGAALALRGVTREAGVRFSDLRHVFGTGIGEDVPIDVLFGTWGYLLPPGTAAAVSPDFALWGDTVRWVDDIWLSAQLARAGIDRFVVPVQGLPLETLATLRGSLSGGLNRTGDNEQAALEALGDFWGGQSAQMEKGRG